MSQSASPSSPGDDLQPVPLQELRLLSGGRSWTVEQQIGELETLTPVRGYVQVLHHGGVLEVRGQAETIVTLCCARCLQHFNHPLSASAQELLEIDASLAAETMGLASAECDDRLDPVGLFDPQRWIFEQLSLQLPLVNRCGSDCPGPERWSSDARAGDPRWAALRHLSTS
ncbi:MAG: DUF177 domain-containing protein [Cyanobacteria bacterium]|nr:DUF177 domain-containing protein [Cyanobacteriota bacterium]